MIANKIAFHLVLEFLLEPPYFWIAPLQLLSHSYIGQQQKGPSYETVPNQLLVKSFWSRGRTSVTDGKREREFMKVIREYSSYYLFLKVP